MDPNSRLLMLGSSGASVIDLGDSNGFYWMLRYDSGVSPGDFQLARRSSNSTIVVSCRSYSSNYIGFLHYFNTDGTLASQVEFGNPLYSDPSTYPGVLTNVTDFEAGVNDTFYHSGYATMAGWATYVHKYTGTTRDWSIGFDLTANTDIYGGACSLFPSGSALFVGINDPTNYSFDAGLARITPQGGLTYAYTYSGFGTFIEDIYTNETAVWMAARRDGIESSLMRVTESGGSVVWAYTYATGFRVNSTNHCLYVNSSNECYIAARYYSGTRDYAVIRKIDANGNIVWTGAYGDPSSYGTQFLGIHYSSSDQHLYLYGFTEIDGQYHGFLVKMSEQGGEAWRRQLVTPNATYFRTMTNIGGVLYVGGQIDGVAGFIKVPADGGFTGTFGPGNIYEWKTSVVPTAPNLTVPSTNTSLSPNRNTFSYGINTYTASTLSYPEALTQTYI